MEPIYVTKTFLPPLAEYQKYVEKIWENGQITNQGPLLQELEESLQQKLGVSNLQLLANGTLALQVAFKALGIEEGEIITTPFSYVATTSAVLWERLKPVFVDINPDTYCIDAQKIEEKITKDTKAILAVHVFGYPCDVEKIQAIADKHDLKVVYDGAHAFGAQYKGKSLLDYGDISMSSLHATKLFHTVEGGFLVAKDKGVAANIDLIKRFGHNGDEHYCLGINAKMSELHAAMGLCNLPYVNDNIADRRAISEQYKELLSDKLAVPDIARANSHNYAYFPVLFSDTGTMESTITALNEQQIFPRRYFYPSLNKLPYLQEVQPCPVSEDIASRVVCLPLYAGLAAADVARICSTINAVVD